MANKEWTVEDLIRWRISDLSLQHRSARHVVDMLSVEILLDSKIPLAAVSAVRRFRKLNEAARLSRVTMILHAKRRRSAPSNIDDLRNHLVGLFLRRSGNEESAASIVMTIEDVIEAKLNKLLGLGHSPEVHLDPKKPAAFQWTPLGRNWQCRLGTMMVGDVRNVGNDLYEAVLGTTRLAGVHACNVAKKRVEQAFSDAAKAVANA
jgi:hypothetical protein